MKGRARRGHRNGLVEPADYGSGFRLRDTHWVPVTALAAGQDMELAEIPDIDRPDQRRTRRVARRIDPLLCILDIHSKGGPGREQFLAAERFRNDVKRADGQNASHIDRLDRVSSSAIPDLTQQQLDAQMRVRAAWLAIRGAENDAMAADVVRLVVLGWASLNTIAKGRRCRHGVARRLLDEGLNRLVEHYEGWQRR